jgi:hypothetical protein
LAEENAVNEKHAKGNDGEEKVGKKAKHKGGGYG